MIQAVNLSKRYGSFEAVRGVSFDVGSGRVVGLLGPNGAGKTSIMKVLTGYHRPSSGLVTINGINVADDPLAVKAMVGYLPEGVPLYVDMTVGEYLEFIAEARGLAHADREGAALKAMGACGLDGMFDVRIDHLSKGYRQRVGLAQAIIHDPPILILDEPTTGLDPNQILEIRSLIRSLGSQKTVILSTHILQEVEALCSEVLILNEGRIVAQGSAALLAEQLQGDERLDVVLSGARLPESPEESLESRAGILAAERVEGPAGRLRLRLTAPAGSGDTAAEAVFDWAVENKLRILELKRERLSLEEIFVKLTGEDTEA